MSREHGRFFTSTNKERRMLFGLGLPLSTIVLLCLMSTAVFSADPVVLSWKTPLLNTDPAYYKIYYGTEPGEYPNSVTVSDPSLIGRVLDLQEEYTYYFVVTAYDSSNNESPRSNMESRQVGYTSCDSDINFDGSVNFLDLAIGIDEFFGCSDTCRADINDDSDVDFQDLAIMRSHFFSECIASCPPCESYPGTCPKVTLPSGTVCNEAITSITIHKLDE